MNNRRKFSRSAFTLIEVLVVISIIGVLVGILLPSLQKARQSAKDTQCMNRLRTLYILHSHYIQDYDSFPALNNDPDDGTWQYNYLIYDGRDYDENFGPLINTGILDDVRILFCPVQEDLYHSQGTRFNPWPPMPFLDSRSSYARRYHLSGKSFSQFKSTRAMIADVFHLPQVVKSAHKTGVNVVYTDGHGRWVDAPTTLLKNELSNPFDPLDNEIVKEIWKKLDRPSQRKDQKIKRAIGG